MILSLLVTTILAVGNPILFPLDIPLTTFPDNLKLTPVYFLQISTLPS